MSALIKSWQVNVSYALAFWKVLLWLLYRNLKGPFKLRYNNHNNTFRKAKHKNSTFLSKYIWDLKDNDIDPILHKMAESHKTV